MRFSVECAFPSHPARRLRFSVECAFPHLRKRGVASRKSALCPDASRKSAFCDRHPHGKPHSATRPTRRLTQKRILHPTAHAKAHSDGVPHQKAHSVCERWRRVRLSVRVRVQNALFRRMRFSSPAQTWRRLTQKRILHPTPHGKPHSDRATAPKGAFCMRAVTQSVPFREAPTPECAFP